MALTNEDLQAIAQLLQPMQDSITRLEGNFSGMQGTINKMQDSIDGMQGTINKMQDTIDGMQDSITNLQLHIENVTDTNIQLLAENHIELTKKLNQLIPVADNNRAYEVKVNYLFEKVSNLEKEVAALKGKIA